MKHKLSACILIPTLAVLYTWLKVRSKMHTQFMFHLSCLFQCFLLQSLLILKISNFILELFVYFFLASMQSYSYAPTIENVLFLSAQAG